MPFVELVADWAKRTSTTPVPFVLGWVLARGEHIVPIPGTTNPAHLDDFLGAEKVKLSAADWAAFDADFAKLDIMGHRADPLTESQFDHS